MMGHIKKGILLYLLLLVCSSFTKCQDIQATDLVGCWMHSYEEETKTSNHQAYRSCDYKDFPPSRFRFSMELNIDGSCKWLVLSPSDAHYMTEGTWSFTKSSNLLELFSKTGELVKSYELAAVEPALLLLSPTKQ